MPKLRGSLILGPLAALGAFFLCRPAAVHGEDYLGLRPLAQPAADRGLDLEKSNWEFGFRFGQVIAQGDKSLTIGADNSVFLASDPSTPGEDEFKENNLASPDFSGTTALQGTLDRSLLFGAHLYYKALPWVSVGVEASIASGQDVKVSFGGPFASPIYTTTYRMHSLQPVLAVRIGDWVGPLRPWAMAGFGPYFIYQKVTSELNDADDPQHPPVVAADQSDAYGSLLYGVGLDIRFFDEGSVGLGLQYQQVYASPHSLKFAIPMARFTCHF